MKTKDEKNELLARNGSGMGLVSSRSVQPNQKSEIFHSTMVLGLQKRWFVVYFQKHWKINMCKNELLGRNGSGIGLVSSRLVEMTGQVSGSRKSRFWPTNPDLFEENRVFFCFSRAFSG